MSEAVDMWKEMHEEDKEVRAQWREKAPKVLSDAHINFAVKNNGAHLIVEGGEGFIDYWPGTGKWVDRKNRTRGFGLNRLIRFAREGR